MLYLTSCAFLIFLRHFYQSILCFIIFHIQLCYFFITLTQDSSLILWLNILFRYNEKKKKKENPDMLGDHAMSLTSTNAAYLQYNL